MLHALQGQSTQGSFKVWAINSIFPIADEHSLLGLAVHLQSAVHPYLGT